MAQGKGRIDEPCDKAVDFLSRLVGSLACPKAVRLCEQLAGEEQAATATATAKEAAAVAVACIRLPPIESCFMFVNL